MVDAARLAVFVDDQVLGPVHETERAGIERAVGLARFRGTIRRRNRLRIRRLVAERTRRIDRAEQQLQQVQRAAGVEAVAVRADAAHRMHGHRAADHLRVLAAPAVGPGDGQREFRIERGFRQFARDAANGVGGDAAAFADRIRRVLRIEVAVRDELEDRTCFPSVRQHVLADDGGGDADGVGVGYLAPSRSRCALASLPRLRGRGGVGGELPAQRIPVRVAREQAIVGAAGVVDHQPVRVRVVHQVIEVDAIHAQQFVRQREREQAVGAGADADPLVGDGAVTAAHRVDRNDFRAARLQLAEAELDRVGIVVFGHAPQHQIPRVFPVRFAEFPETAAQRVQPARGHVHRAEAAVRGVVEGAELLRPPAGQRLRLVAAGEEREFVRVAFADRRQPRGRDVERFVPFDFAEFACAAFADA